MKIVLNEMEINSMAVYVLTNMDLTIDTYSIFDKEQAIQMKEMSVNDMTNIMLENIPFINVEEVDKNDNYHVDIDPLFLMSYTELMSSSLQALRPYAKQTAQTVFNHKDSLEQLPQKFGALKTLANKPLIMKGIDFVAGLLGIKELVHDLMDLGIALSNDEETQMKLDIAHMDFAQSLMSMYPEPTCDDSQSKYPW